jgi:hypothetical protein
MHPQMRQRDDELGRDDELVAEDDLRHDDERAPDTDEPARDTDERARDTDERAPDTDERAPDRVAAGSPSVELFEPGDVDRFRSGWSDVQTRFVDDPREAVEGADRLVAAVMESLTSRFADRKHELEARWQHGSEAGTEDLRQAMRGYRSFFDRLLNV